MFIDGVGVKRCNKAKVKICQHKQRYVYCSKTCQCPPNSKWQTAFGSHKTVKERKNLSTGHATWQHDYRELSFRSKLLFRSMQCITWKSGSPIRQPPSSHGQGILTPPSSATPAELLCHHTKPWIIHSARWQKSEKSQYPGEKGGTPGLQILLG